MTAALAQRIVSFHGDDLIGIQTEDGTVYAPFNTVCDNLGLQRDGQAQRIQRHAVLSDALVVLTVTTPGGPQQMRCLRIDALPLWLAGLQASRVKPELQEKLIRYQKEAATVLWQAFKPQIIVADRDDDLSISTDAELVQLHQIADLGRAITRMAEEQFEQRRRMDAAARAFQGMRRDITDVQVRLDILEDRLTPASVITDAQAAEVSNRVKALAELLTTKDQSKNHYQAIFSELYRRFNVSSYKLIQQIQYDNVLAFLEAWRVQFAAE